MFELFLFIASALIGSGILFQHKRVLTYIAVAGALFEAELLLATILHRTIATSVNGPTFFLAAGILLTALSLAFYKQWKSPYSTPGSGKRDIYPGITLIIVLAFAYPIISANGFIGQEFVMHGFYNGDVVTFASLIQKSFNTSLLVSTNPFSANGTLEYPTLLHGGVADFFSMLGIGKDWLQYLAIMTYAQIVITIPLFFLVWDTVYPEPKNPAEKWFGLVSRTHVYALQTILTLGAIFLSFDSFIYPQSHFFLMGIFFMLIALFVKASTLSGTKQLLPLIPALVFAYLLLNANTVTGTIAAAATGTLCLLRVFDKKQPIPHRAAFLLLGALTVLAMKYSADGRTSFTNLHFSVSAAFDMVRAGLPALFILGASFYSLSKKQYLSVTAGVSAFLGFLIFFLSDRNIVTENASRFLYHSVLVGFVLFLPIAIQLLYVVRRELLLTARPMGEYIGGWIITLCSLLILILPIGISTGTTYASLLGDDEHHITLNMRTAMWWIDEHAPVNSVVITNSYEPFMVPLFTGRAMLRAKDYWLSQQDETLTNLEQAFSGDKQAQTEILKQGNLLVLAKDDVKLWDVTKLKKEIDTGDLIVYSKR